MGMQGIGFRIMGAILLGLGLGRVIRSHMHPGNVSLEGVVWLLLIGAGMVALGIFLGVKFKAPRKSRLRL